MLVVSALRKEKLIDDVTLCVNISFLFSGPRFMSGEQRQVWTEFGCWLCFRFRVIWNVSGTTSGSPLGSDLEANLDPRGPIPVYRRPGRKGKSREFLVNRDPRAGVENSWLEDESDKQKARQKPGSLGQDRESQVCVRIQ